MKVVVFFCVIAYATASLQSVLNCMNRGYSNPIGEEYSPFFVHRNNRLLSCKPEPINECTWTNSAVHATLFVYRNYQLITSTRPRRQLDTQTWRLTRDLNLPGRVMRVFDKLYPLGAKAAFLRLLDVC